MNIEEIMIKVNKKISEDGDILSSDISQIVEGDSVLRDEVEKELNKNNIIIITDEEAEETPETQVPEEDVLEESEPDEVSLNILEVENIESEIIDIETISTAIKVDDPVRMYLKEIGQVPLLKFEEEQKYANQVLDGRFAKEQLEDYHNNELELSAKDIKVLEDVIEVAAIAKTKLVEANYRLVVSIAKHYSNNNSNMLLLDLVQEGNMGLMRAVDKFDPQKGFKFSTYATWWIRQAITRAVADQARTIRIPVHMVETINKMARVQRQLFQELEREPSVEEIAERMSMTPEKIQSIQRIAKEPISLEAPVGEEEDSSLGDFISDPNALNPHEYMMQERKQEALDNLLSSVLTDREEKVLRLRYGLIDGKNHTLEDVGRVFGVTRERIRQIEGKALRRLKSPSKQIKLKEFYTTTKK